MSSPSAGKRRIDTDVIKLIESKHKVTILGGLNEFFVKFVGPRETPYEGGVWKLLTYPNPVDPLNVDAATMYLHKPEEYRNKVADYVRRYATEGALREQEQQEQSDGSDSESSMSDFSENEAQDMEL
ncbi:ubiquitin-conjugating enzyme E2 H-like isoform X2 [Anopheles bellator]|uniref:ubiquitin-conjugating enzyme E2 H-like isoform X2 n=1 Tax=Anopheles bellator TaxID=139047 RepID=UPI002647933A|nr:ubiquitin-conjugating enzyme E2 H-like isoform X2 [Anopheles bellator]